jgi:hypothetical protein
MFEWLKQLFTKQQGDISLLSAEALIGLVDKRSVSSDVIVATRKLALTDTGRRGRQAALVAVAFAKQPLRAGARDSADVELMARELHNAKRTPSALGMVPVPHGTFVEWDNLPAEERTALRIQANYLLGTFLVF